jgi:Tfp pilus assembly PilM family ATPase
MSVMWSDTPELPVDTFPRVGTHLLHFELVQELGRALQFFFNSTQYNKVNQVLLAGGSALLPGLALAVANQVQVPCTVVNPFEGMSVGARVDRSRVLQDAPSYLGACGLALRSRGPWPSFFLVRRCWNMLLPCRRIRRVTDFPVPSDLNS